MLGTLHSTEEEGRDELEMYWLPPMCQSGVHVAHTSSYFITSGGWYATTRLQMRKLELQGVHRALKCVQLVEKRLRFVVGIELKGIWLQCARPAEYHAASLCAGSALADWLLLAVSHFSTGVCAFSLLTSRIKNTWP